MMFNVGMMQMFDIKKELGQIVRRRRRDLGLSQEALAERANLHRTYVTDIERGSRNISIESISKLAAALGVSIGALFPPETARPATEQKDGANPPVEILLVEDNSRDVELTIAAFKHARLSNNVHVVRDGAAALDFLFCRGEYRLRDPEHLPQVVLLDLGLPKLHGLEVLRRIKEHERTRHIKVVVLSISRDEAEIREALLLGADTYISKPVDFHNFSEIVPRLSFHWTLFQRPSPN